MQIIVRSLSYGNYQPTVYIQVFSLCIHGGSADTSLAEMH